MYICVCVSVDDNHPANSLPPTQVGGREGRTDATPATATNHNLHPAYNYIVLDKWINGQEGWLSSRLVLCVCVCTQQQYQAGVCIVLVLRGGDAASVLSLPPT